ncbi:hypothetical protein ACFE04_001378 [Oxalis oulophora]
MEISTTYVCPGTNEKKIGKIYLCLDIVGIIVSFIPLKTRTRWKLVSTSWCDKISEIRSFSPLTTSHDLIVPGKHENIHIKPKDLGEECQLETTIGVNLNFANCELVNSCDGLFIFAFCSHSYYERFIIYNPSNRQRLSVNAPIAKLSLNTYVYTLLDDVQQNLKLICYEYNRDTRCYMFSSQTWEWENIDVVLRLFCAMTMPDYFHNMDGKLCTMMDYHHNHRMLIYDTKRNLVEQFSMQLGFRFQSILWNSEGVLHTCTCDHNTFEIYYCKNGVGTWHLKHSVLTLPIKKLLEEMNREAGVKDYTPYIMKVVSFNDDLHTLNFQAGNSIVAYSLETQKLSIVAFNLWSAERIKKSYILRTVKPFVSNYADLSRIKKGGMPKQKADGQSIERMLHEANCNA